MERVFCFNNMTWINSCIILVRIQIVGCKQLFSYQFPTLEVMWETCKGGCAVLCKERGKFMNTSRYLHVSGALCCKIQILTTK